MRVSDWPTIFCLKRTNCGLDHAKFQGLISNLENAIKNVVTSVEETEVCEISNVVLFY